jgi:hypothetical protein
VLRQEVPLPPTGYARSARCRGVCKSVIEEDLRQMKPALERRAYGADARDAGVAEEGGEEETLLCVGSRRLGAARRAMLGSVSTKVLRTARGAALGCPHRTRDVR